MIDATMYFMLSYMMRNQRQPWLGWSIVIGFMYLARAIASLDLVLMRWESIVFSLLKFAGPCLVALVHHLSMIDIHSVLACALIPGIFVAHGGWAFFMYNLAMPTNDGSPQGHLPEKFRQILYIDCLAWKTSDNILEEAAADIKKQEEANKVPKTDPNKLVLPETDGVHKNAMNRLSSALQKEHEMNRRSGTNMNIDEQNTENKNANSKLVFGGWGGVPNVFDATFGKSSSSTSKPKDTIIKGAKWELKQKGYSENWADCIEHYSELKAYVDTWESAAYKDMRESQRGQRNNNSRTESEENRRNTRAARRASNNESIDTPSDIKSPAFNPTYSNPLLKNQVFDPKHGNSADSSNVSSNRTSENPNKNQDDISMNNSAIIAMSGVGESSRQPLLEDVSEVDEDIRKSFDQNEYDESMNPHSVLVAENMNIYKNKLKELRSTMFACLEAKRLGSIFDEIEKKQRSISHWVIMDDYDANTGMYMPYYVFKDGKTIQYSVPDTPFMQSSFISHGIDELTETVENLVHDCADRIEENVLKRELEESEDEANLGGNRNRTNKNPQSSPLSSPTTKNVAHDNKHLLKRSYTQSADALLKDGVAYHGDDNTKKVMHGHLTDIMAGNDDANAVRNVTVKDGKVVTIKTKPKSLESQKQGAYGTAKMRPEKERQCANPNSRRERFLTRARTKVDRVTSWLRKKKRIYETPNIIQEIDTLEETAQEANKLPMHVFSKVMRVLICCWLVGFFINLTEQAKHYHDHLRVPFKELLPWPELYADGVTTEFANAEKSRGLNQYFTNKNPSVITVGGDGFNSIDVTHVACSVTCGARKVFASNYEIYNYDQETCGKDLNTFLQENAATMTTVLSSHKYSASDKFKAEAGALEIIDLAMDRNCNPVVLLQRAVVKCNVNAAMGSRWEFLPLQGTWDGKHLTPSAIEVNPETDDVILAIDNVDVPQVLVMKQESAMNDNIPGGSGRVYRPLMPFYPTIPEVFKSRKAKYTTWEAGGIETEILVNDDDRLIPRSMFVTNDKDYSRWCATNPTKCPNFNAEENSEEHNSALPYIHTDPGSGAHKYVLNVATYDYFGAYDGVNPFVKIPNVNVLSICLQRDPKDFDKELGRSRDTILAITQPGHPYTGGTPELVKFRYDELVKL